MNISTPTVLFFSLAVNVQKSLICYKLIPKCPLFAFQIFMRLYQPCQAIFDFLTQHINNIIARFNMHSSQALYIQKFSKVI